MDILLEAVTQISQELGSRLKTLINAHAAGIISLEQYQAQEQEIKKLAQSILVPAPEPLHTGTLLTATRLQDICDVMNAELNELSEEDYLIYASGRQICRVNLSGTYEEDIINILKENT